MRPPVFRLGELSKHIVCDVVEISFKSLKETIVRVLEFLSQQTSLRSRRLK